jgi:preprotein translocase, SecE subunit, bacterial
MASKQKKQDKSAPQGGPAAVTATKSPGKIQSFVQYIESAKTELGKVSWPTKKEVKVTSIAVLILVVVMCFFLGIVDLILSKIIEAILSMGLSA